MTALKKFLIIIVLLGAALAALPLVIPYDRWTPDIERALKQRLDIDTHVGGIAFSYDPRPQLVLSGVTLGKNGEGAIGKVVIPVTLRNLMHMRSELADVTLQDAQLQQDFAVSLPARLKPSQSDKEVRFASLKLDNATVALRKGAIGPMSGLVKLNPDGTFKDITVTDKDGRGELNIKPLNEKFSLEFTGRNWTLPGGYDARFDQLVMRGLADHDGITIDYISGLIFGAAAIGQAQLTWGDGWKLSGSLETKGMQAEPLISLFSASTRATGRLTANATFQYAGEDYETLFQKPHIEMQFTLNDGDLHNFDLITPLKSQDPSMLRRGGQTRYDSFSGLAVLDNDVVTLSKLQLNGGKFTASGNVAINDKRQISGHVSARLSAGALAVSAPLAISGKLDSPEIRSGGAFKPGGEQGTTQIF